MAPAVFLAVFLAGLALPRSECLCGPYDDYPEYLQAVEDAKEATAAEVSKNLVAIVKDNDNLALQWEGDVGNSRVLTITWTNKSYYDTSVGKDYTLPDDANVWVTVVPELRNFIRKNFQNVATLRIEQVLGLPPNSGKTKFIEIWVNPKDLFRPSPDPEITDHEASLVFPTTLNRFLAFDNSAHVIEYDYDKKADVSYTYRQWFRQRRQAVYSGDYPYPWTRLGYTYDWGTASSHVGLSEFVILGGSTIGIRSIITNDDYLKGTNTASLQRNAAERKTRSKPRRLR